ncbi:hypothetical protein [Qipengyuania sp. 902]|uniref:hypothetical protein n=1 Tax=Qipengyuania sp. 902 TaxID=3417565 RepID=UPI003EB86AF3
MKIDMDDIDQAGLTDQHKLAMAECTLAWARFESQFRAMLTVVENRSLLEGAKDYDRLQLSMGWTKLRQRLRDAGAVPEVLAKVKDLQRQSKFHYEARKNIAHAGCVGVLKRDPQYIVFAPFEAHQGDQMVILATPLEEIERSTTWADAARAMAMRIMRQAGH